MTDWPGKLWTMGFGNTPAAVTPGNPIPSAQMPAALVAGDVTGWSVVKRFGRNTGIGTSYEPIAGGGLWPVPQAASVTALRVKAGGNANDTAAGSGAREVTFSGLSATGALQSEAEATAGASASTATTATFLRILDITVSTSGTYGTLAGASHAAAVTVENGAGGTDWGVISATGFAMGRSQIGAYTIPLGYTGYVANIRGWAAPTQVVDFLFASRVNVTDAAAPYDAWKAEEEFLGISGALPVPAGAVYGPYAALTDVCWFAKAGSNGDASVAFDVILAT